MRNPFQPMPVTPSTHPARAAFVTALLVLVGGALAACGDSAESLTIERETFIEAYTRLRVAALDTDSARLADSDRTAILSELGVTEQDLLTFVEVHAERLEYMRDVWNEIELRLDRAPERPAERQ